MARRRLVAILDHVLDGMQDVPSSLEWSTHFNGALKPVAPAENITLQAKSGRLPEDLAGVYMRVGPNSPFWPPQKRTHVFDADGMVHCVRIINGKATYHCKMLETPRYQYEKEYGAEWFTRIGELHGKAGLAKILAVSGQKHKIAGLEDWETSVANTAICFHPSGKLWALNEAGPPFRFRLDENGTPKSIGYDTLEDKLRKPMSAHPKFDQRTGDLYFHGRQLMKSFYASRVVNGEMQSADLQMPTGFHHDMFITEHFAVIIDGSMRFDQNGIVQGKPLWGFNPKSKLRFAVFPRSTKEMTPDAFIWIDTDVAAECVHTLYAYDEGGKIVLFAPLGFYEKGKEDGILGGQGPFYMHRTVIDVDQKLATVEKVTGGDKYMSEFPRIRDDRIGLRTRYGFTGVQSQGPDFKFTGILKWDFEQSCLCNEIHFPENVIGGEPVFLPRTSGGNGVDDDGYIGMFLWNSEKLESTWALFDAQTFSSTPVAELLVPRRVPLGFHAAWITEEQFQMQLHAP
eukprot:TRINITY_DN28740_c0_g1_i1.p1 TRINITY_DN28740_c0_g1~~TRINITY_DN28740_c0_g1_i1.p1  ORF type:complete len:513 (-),score=62.65 TRINITY_DN28740_c0_g1_i1:431-1969(-)